MSYVDTRRDYMEVREVGFALIGTRLYCVVFTQRGDVMHVISLRMANTGRYATMRNTIKTRSGRVLEVPTAEENEAINRGVAADPDTYEVPDEVFRKMKRVGGRGRPRSESPKVLLSVRYDADIVEAFKATGDGWQTRMNDALRDWLRDHQPA
jgi:uncharacterized protein (DUF4415 family)